MFSMSSVWNVGAVTLSVLMPSIVAQTYSYTLQDVYAGDTFYNNFNFYTGADPTNGFVEYVDQATANTNGILGFGSGTAKWGVDDTNIISNTSEGRLSVRLEGNTNYNHGLFLADIKHMPGSICGVWPAFWTLGDSTWPAHGEVDIIEGVNMATSNQVSAHTAPSCTVSYQNQTGTAINTDCSLATGGSDGCQSAMYDANDYGTNFNSNGGGVYAMQWTSGFIKIWFFPRNNIPASITAGTPNVDAFGTPGVNMDGTNCNIDTHFINHRIVFDTSFCGDWAGAVYSSSSCPLASSGSNGCVNYVANNPSAFSEAYWEVNSIKIYQESTSASSSSASSASVSTSSATSASLPSSTTISTSQATSTSSATSSKATSTTASTSSSKATSTTTSASSSKPTSTTTSTSSSKPTTSSTSSSKISSTLVTSTLVTSTRISTTSTKTSSTSSGTATATAAACPANNGQIYVSNNKRFLIECSTDHANGNLKMVYVTGGLASCIAQCATTTGCVDATLSGTACYMKSSLGASSASTSANGARLLTS